MQTTEPLIFTTKGNLPIASLAYAHAWDDRPDAMVFTETYSLDGEVVKHSVHVYSKRGLAAEAEAGAIN